MNWGTGFKFGDLNTAQSDLFENKPDLAYQRLLDFFGGGNAGFQNTVFGRYLNSQQGSMYNRFLDQQSANPTGDLTWKSYLESQAPQAYQEFRNLPSFMRGSNPKAMGIKRELW